MAASKPELEELLVPDAAAWGAWLEEHHAGSPGVWLVLHKKGGDVTRLTYDAALEEALCHGWIDGQARRRDEGSTFVRFTPRRARSNWSARNVGIVERLEREGRMREPGRAVVEAARADGRWDAAYGGPGGGAVPDDLAAALAADPEARAMFDVLTRGNRTAVIYQVTSAKRSETRARRVRELVAALARRETPLPQKARPE